MPPKMSVSEHVKMVENPNLAPPELKKKIEKQKASIRKDYDRRENAHKDEIDGLPVKHLKQYIRDNGGRIDKYDKKAELKRKAQGIKTDKILKRVREDK